jgi:hypothetical protein
MPETLPEEMKGLQSIVDQAKDFDIAVYRELKKSQALVEQKFYTEAALRLGRAVEASIYSTARELGVSVSLAGLERLDQIGDEIKVSQVTIAQGQKEKGIKKLLKCVKDIADVVDTLVAPSNDQKTKGQSRERPLPNRQLYKAFQDQIDLLEIKQDFGKDSIKAKLGKESSQVDDSLQIRNQAAHASLDGNEREVDREKYMDLASKVSTVIETLFDIRLMMKSFKK